MKPVLGIDVIQSIRSSSSSGEVDLNKLADIIGVKATKNLKYITLEGFTNELLNWASSGNILIVTNEDVGKFVSMKYGVTFTYKVNSYVQHIDHIIMQFGECVTAKAKAGLLDIVVGREDETEECLNILCRRLKKNVILVGGDGVGKTSIVHNIAQRIIEGKVPPKLLGRQIYLIDPSKVTMGTIYRGMLEQNIQSIISSAIATNAILFFSEISTILDKQSMTGTIGEMLMPYVGSTPLSLIACANDENYREFVVTNKDVNRKFEKVIIEEPLPDLTKEIISKTKHIIEGFHNVKVPTPVISTIVEMSGKYIPDRCNPDISLDILERTAVNVSRRATRLVDWKSHVIEDDFMTASNIRNTFTVDPSLCVIKEKDVIETVSRMTGMKVLIDDATRVDVLKDELLKRVINQETAIDTVTDAIRTSYLFNDSKKPLGSFLFIGSSSVGKTLLAKMIAEQLFYGKILKLDMSEYSEQFTVSRLIGSSPGYIGYQEGGVLTNWVMGNPYSVVLFDEIEKADPSIYNILLSIMDDGKLTDMRGIDVKFNNTLIIMTSNIGTKHILTEKPFGIGFGGEKKSSKESVTEDVEKFFKPEFRDRLSKVIIFNKLRREDLIRIIDLELNELITPEMPRITLSDNVKEMLLSDWKDGDGARSIRRKLNELVLSNVSKYIIENKTNNKKLLSVDYITDDGDLVIEETK